jgi:hypothetical protein
LNAEDGVQKPGQNLGQETFGFRQPTLQPHVVNLPSSNRRFAHTPGVLIATVGCTGPYRGTALLDPSEVPAGKLVAESFCDSCTDSSDAYQRVCVDDVVARSSP